jgi:branched-chain amino acid transport system ATP-binding protein
VVEVAALSGPAAAARSGPGTPLLETVRLQKTFGGLQAVRSVDFRLDRGEIRAIIGPNGAGKTTLVSMISGRIAPTSGAVLFGGREITRVPAYARVALGIVYTFQITSIFRTLSVFENVALAAQRRLATGFLSPLSLSRTAVAGRVGAALAAVGLREAGDLPAGSLPYGHQRLLEVAMALALEPSVVILDEPTQGLSPEEIARLMALIRVMARSATVLLIEHNMRVVLDLSQRITVMDKGSVIAEGTPREIEANPQVQRVYLGG